MAYEVTATRRRPQTFEDLIGQEFVAATLKNSIESGKIAHAYLFSGPRGCGKTSTARILAKALNCQKGPTATPCGTCSTCQEITKGSSLDVIEIDGASNTSVNDIRQIKDEVMFPPNSCRYKIYIIDEVHMLSTSAFNALLKTIEEPPPYVIFIFATTELQKVPATIKSRCQQFNFRLVAIEKIKEQLAEACKDINITADDEALYWIARESTGSMRDAYTLFDQIAAFSDSHITFEKIRDKLGLVGTERLNEIFEFCIDEKTSEVIQKIDEFLQSGISIEQLITNCSDYLRSLLLIKNGIAKESLLGQAVERYSKKVLENWNSVQIERALSIFLSLYRDIKFSLSPRYEIELSFSKLCWLKNYVSPAEIKKAIDSAQSLLQKAGTSPAVQNYASRNLSEAPQYANSDVRSQPAFEAGAQGGQQGAQMATFNALSGNVSESGFEREKEQESPFSDGGALPPKTTAADLEKVKAKIIATTSIDDAFISTGLMQTGKWVLNGNVIETTIESDFQKSQLETKSREIAEYISNILGQKVSFSISLLQKEEEQIQREIPEQVNIIAKTFKGTILGGQ
ncbi:MAG: DNA polymerase III subunit gamma/tau [Treponema sp.]